MVLPYCHVGQRDELEAVVQHGVDCGESHS
jgi:hypothetical protein